MARAGKIMCNSVQLYKHDPLPVIATTTDKPQFLARDLASLLSLMFHGFWAGDHAATVDM